MLLILLPFSKKATPFGLPLTEMATGTNTVSDGLTTLARKGWTLEVGESDFHAARGAAWLAGKSAGLAG